MAASRASPPALAPPAPPPHASSSYVAVPHPSPSHAPSAPSSSSTSSPSSSPASPHSASPRHPHSSALPSSPHTPRRGESPVRPTSPAASTLLSTLRHRLECTRRVRLALSAEVPPPSLPSLSRAAAALLAHAASFDEFAAALLRHDHLASLSLRAAYAAYAACLPLPPPPPAPHPSPPLASLLPSPPLAPPPSPHDARVISFDALRRARTTLDDFTAFYLPLHGLRRECFFSFLPTLVFVEACIYQLDDDNEARARGAAAPPPRTSATDAALRGVLRAEGLLCGEVERQLEAGEAYWAMERRLCAAMRRGEAVELEEVFRASALKSFDYRVLHAILGTLSRSPASAALRRFLEIDERLTDLADDLCDYEKDVASHAFNALRGAAHAVGAAAPLALAQLIGQLEAEHEAALAALPAAQREAYCRCRAAALTRRPGCDKWSFPPLLLPAEEAAFRGRAAEASADEWEGSESPRSAGGLAEGEAAAAAAAGSPRGEGGGGAGAPDAEAHSRKRHRRAALHPTLSEAWLHSSS